MEENKDLMQPEQFTELSKGIVEAGGDQGKLTALLTQLQDGYAKLFATHTSVTENNDKLVKENGELKQYNMDLFLRLGAETTPTMKETKQEQDTKTRAETIKVADLFKKEEK